MPSPLTKTIVHPKHSDENVMDVFLNSSCGKLLNDLMQIYNLNESNFEKFCALKHKEIEQWFSEYEQQKNITDSLYPQIIKGPKTAVMLTTFHLAKENKSTGEIEVETKSVTNQQAIALVFAALADDENCLRLHPTISLQEERNGRLEDFYKRLKELTNSPRCPQGWRNELVSLLVGVFKGARIIEDSQTTIVMLLKSALYLSFDFLKTAFEKNIWDLPQAEVEKFLLQLQEGLLAWYFDSEPEALIEIIDQQVKELAQRDSFQVYLKNLTKAEISTIPGVFEFSDALQSMVNSNQTFEAILTAHVKQYFLAHGCGFNNEAFKIINFKDLYSILGLYRDDSKPSVCSLLASLADFGYKLQTPKAVSLFARLTDYLKKQKTSFLKSDALFHQLQDFYLVLQVISIASNTTFQYIWRFNRLQEKTWGINELDAFISHYFTQLSSSKAEQLDSQAKPELEDPIYALPILDENHRHMLQTTIIAWEQRRDLNEKNTLLTVIENFFAFFHDHCKNDDKSEILKMYELLYDSNFQKMILDTDFLRALLTKSFDQEQVCNVTVSQANWIFLYALIAPMDTWPQDFLPFFDALLNYLEEKLMTSTEVHHQTLLKSSYPKPLLSQLKYLSGSAKARLHTAEEATANQKETPEKPPLYIIMPGHITSFEDLLQARFMLPEIRNNSALKSVTLTYTIKIVQKIFDLNKETYIRSIRGLLAKEPLLILTVFFFLKSISRSEAFDLVKNVCTKETLQLATDWQDSIKNYICYTYNDDDDEDLMFISETDSFQNKFLEGLLKAHPSRDFILGLLCTVPALDGLRPILVSSCFKNQEILPKLFNTVQTLLKFLDQTFTPRPNEQFENLISFLEKCFSHASLVKMLHSHEDILTFLKYLHSSTYDRDFFPFLERLFRHNQKLTEIYPTLQSLKDNLLSELNDDLFSASSNHTLQHMLINIWHKLPNHKSKFGFFIPDVQDYSQSTQPNQTTSTSMEQPDISSSSSFSNSSQ